MQSVRKVGWKSSLLILGVAVAVWSGWTQWGRLPASDAGAVMDSAVSPVQAGVQTQTTTPVVVQPEAVPSKTSLSSNAIVATTPAVISPAPLPPAQGPAVQSPRTEPSERMMTEPVAIQLPGQKAIPAALPEHVVLSDAELQALSPQERKQYDAMLKSLQALRQQAEQLGQERAALEARMGDMEGRNQQLTERLEVLRKQLQETAGAAGLPLKDLGPDTP